MANKSDTEDDKLWMVIRMDIHGTKFLIKDGLNKAAAMLYLDNLKRAQQKLHGQDYKLLSYRRRDRATAISDHRIVI